MLPQAFHPEGVCRRGCVAIADYMKTLLHLIGILVILVILSSPALAISKSELMAHYRTTPESPAYPENNPISAKDPGPVCSQSCLCKSPDNGAIVPCICGAVDTSIYYQVITTCYDPTPTPIPTPQIPSWYPKSRFIMKNPNAEAAEDLSRENFARIYFNTFFLPPMCCGNVSIRGQVI
jgi:hypothetical protein